MTDIDGKNMELLMCIEERVGIQGRHFGSKHGYRRRNPNEDTIFNAQILTTDDSTVWYGDFNISDLRRLQRCADLHVTDLLVYTEEARWSGPSKQSLRHRIMSKIRPPLEVDPSAQLNPFLGQ